MVATLKIYRSVAHIWQTTQKLNTVLASEIGGMAVLVRNSILLNQWELRVFQSWFSKLLWIKSWEPWKLRVLTVSKSIAFPQCPLSKLIHETLPSCGARHHTIMLHSHVTTGISTVTCSEVIHTDWDIGSFLLQHEWRLELCQHRLGQCPGHSSVHGIGQQQPPPALITDSSWHKALFYFHFAGHANMDRCWLCISSSFEKSFNVCKIDLQQPTLYLLHTYNIAPNSKAARQP